MNSVPAASYNNIFMLVHPAIAASFVWFVDCNSFKFLTSEIDELSNSNNKQTNWSCGNRLVGHVCIGCSISAFDLFLFIESDSMRQNTLWFNKSNQNRNDSQSNLLLIRRLISQSCLCYPQVVQLTYCYNKMKLINWSIKLELLEFH